MMHSQGEATPNQAKLIKFDPCREFTNSLIHGCYGYSASG